MKNMLFQVVPPYLSRKLLMTVAVSIFLLLTGCTSYVTVFDSETPVNKTAIIQFVDYNGQFTPDTYNGVKLTYTQKAWLRIPAGKATFTGSCSISTYRTNYTIKDIEFSYNFQAGKEYFVGSKFTGQKGGEKAVLNIYEVEFEHKNDDPNKLGKFKVPIEDLEPVAIFVLYQFK
jgi:hypothetical protein